MYAHNFFGQGLVPAAPRKVVPVLWPMLVANEDLAANSRGAACAAVARLFDLSSPRQLRLVVRGVLACCCTDADNASTCTFAKLDPFVFVTFPLHIFSR